VRRETGRSLGATCDPGISIHSLREERDRGATIMDYVELEFQSTLSVRRETLLIAEIRDAITEFEPRANVLNVTVEIDENAPGKVHATVEVEIKDE